MRSTQHYLVAGVLSAELELTLRPSFLVDSPPLGVPEVSVGMPSVRAQLLDARGEPLAWAELAVAPLCGFRDDLSAWLVYGLVPYDTDARRIQLRWTGEHHVVLDVAERGPAVEMTWTPPAVADGIHAITWEIPGSRQGVHSLVTYSPDGGTWIPLSLPGPGRRVVVDFDDLVGGEACRVRVHASDGTMSSTVTSSPFAVTRKGMQVTILHPTPGQTVQPKSILVGQAYDVERRAFMTEGLAWSSHLGGELGTGTTCVAVMSPGRHIVTLTERSSERSATVSVDVDPSAITNPCSPGLFMPPSEDLAEP